MGSVGKLAVPVDVRNPKAAIDPKAGLAQLHEDYKTIVAAGKDAWTETKKKQRPARKRTVLTEPQDDRALGA